MPIAFRSRLHNIVCLVLATAILAGCAASGAAPTPPPAPVTVRFAYRTNVANYLNLADAFHQKYPHITIQLVNTGSQNQAQGQSYGLGLSLTLLKMQAVDVFRDTIPYAPSPQLKNEFLALNEYISADKSFPSSDLLPGLMDALKLEGAQIGVPAGVNPMVGYYDAHRLSSAGAAPPAADWTLDDLLEIAQVTDHQTAAGIDDRSYVIGFCSDVMSADPIIMAYLMGGQIVDSLQNPTRPTMTSAATVRAVEWYAGLRTQHKVTPDPALMEKAFRRGVYEAISMGRCGVWFGSYADMRGRAWGTLWLGDPVMMPLPRAQASFNAAAIDGYFVLRDTTHAEEAWLWLSFLLEHEEASGVQIPPRRTHIQSAAFASRVSADVLAVARGLPTTTTLLSLGSPYSLSALVSVYLEAVARVVSGEIDAKSALAAAQEKALPLLSK